VSIQKHSVSEVCKAGAAWEGDWHHTASANQTQLNWNFCTRELSFPKTFCTNN